MMPSDLVFLISFESILNIIQWLSNISLSLCGYIHQSRQVGILSMHVFERVGVDRSVGVASSSYDVGVSHTGGG